MASASSVHEVMRDAPVAVPITAAALPPRNRRRLNTSPIDQLTSNPNAPATFDRFSDSVASSAWIGLRSSSVSWSYDWYVPSPLSYLESVASIASKLAMMSSYSAPSTPFSRSALMSTITRAPSTLDASVSRSVFGVALFLAGDLAVCRFLDQTGGSVDHRRRVDLDAREQLDEGVDVGDEPGRERLGAVQRVLREHQVLEAVPAGEVGVLFLELEVVGTSVHRRVGIREQLGDRLDPLPLDAGRHVERLGQLEVAGLDRVVQLLVRGNHCRELAVDVLAVGVDVGLQGRSIDLQLGGSTFATFAAHRQRRRAGCWVLHR